MDGLTRVRPPLRPLVIGAALSLALTRGPGLAGIQAQTTGRDGVDVRTVLLQAQDDRVTTASHRAVIAEALGDRRPEVRALALRAAARTQRREYLGPAIEALTHPSIDVRREAAFALAHIGSSDAEARAAVEQALRAGLGREQDALVLAALAEEFGRLPFPDAASLDAAATTLRSALVRASASSSSPAFLEVAVARGAEQLARRAARLNLRPPALRALLQMLAEFRHVDGATAPDALSARKLRLATAGLLLLSPPDDPAVGLALRHPDAQVRRLGVLALSRRDIVAAEQALSLLKDEAMLVRHAAVQRLGAKMPGVAQAALDDSHVHVRLAALQALGEARACHEGCRSRLQRVPDAGGAWHEPAAALVALARTDPAAAAPYVSGAAIGEPWQLRMYAARAAGLTRQADVLTRLSRDSHVNVRHAALVAWREAALPDLAGVALRELASDDGQIVLEAATALKDATPTPPVVGALRAALERLTRQRRETSRDPRLALLDRIAELDPQRTETLRPYLADFDAAVAARAAAILDARQPGQPAVVANPQPLPRAAVPTWDDVVRLDATSVVLTLTGNRKLTIRLFALNAPTAVARLVAQVQAGEWNGRTFHRVEPGFVIQGGSPTANEYAGAAASARDEFSTLSHVRGTVGISTRGPDTGDGQIFVNLVDNVRLDYGFTVIGAITSDPAVLDDVLEGEVIVSAVAQAGARR